MNKEEKDSPILFTKYEDIINAKTSGFLPVGEKAYKLAQVSSVGAAIPSSFILNHNLYTFLKGNNFTSIPENIWFEIQEQIKKLGRYNSTRYGIPSSPLLLTLRADSSPFLHCMLNFCTFVGLNDVIVVSLEKILKSRSLAWNCYRTLIQLYATVVPKISSSHFDNALTQFMACRHLKTIHEFKPIDWVDLVKVFKGVYVQQSGQVFPQDPFIQLRELILKIYASQETSKTANFVSEFYPGQSLKYSIIVSSAVFSSKTEDSCCGSISTRQLNSGENVISGVYSKSAIHSDMTKHLAPVSDYSEFSKDFPNFSLFLNDTIKELERRDKFPQTIDFIIDSGKLFITRAQISQFASTGFYKVLVEMVSEGVYHKEDAIKRLTISESFQLDSFFPGEDLPVFCQGTPSGNYTAVGRAAINPPYTLENPIIFQPFFKASDFPNLKSSPGVVAQQGTEFGSGTILSRLLRKQSISECPNLIFGDHYVECDGKRIEEGAPVTLGSDGKIFIGTAELTKRVTNEFGEQLLGWCDEIRSTKFKVYSTADQTELDALGVRNLDDYFTEEVKAAFLKIILEPNPEKNEVNAEAIAELIHAELSSKLPSSDKTLNLQLSQFHLTSFIPPYEELVKDISKLQVQKAIIETPYEIEHIIPSEEEDGEPKIETEAICGTFEQQELLDSKVSEFNHLLRLTQIDPSYGLKGICLALAFPQILEIQIKAFLKIYAEKSSLRLLLPYAITPSQVTTFKEKFSEISEGHLPKIGISISTARACLIADQFAQVADFLFVDLQNLHSNIYSIDPRTFKRMETVFSFSSPFSKLDEKGIGKYLSIAYQKVFAQDSEYEFGIFGPQINTPENTNFCTKFCSALVTPEIYASVARCSGAQKFIHSYVRIK